jgi:hypothetical protein
LDISQILFCEKGDKCLPAPYLWTMTEDTKTHDLDISASQSTDTNADSAFATSPPRFETFEDFYPYYLSEHANPINRRIHVIGTGLAILCLLQVAMWGLVGGFKYLVLAAIVGYGFAWAGHYFVEKNKPATFTYPAWSLMGDFKMFWEVVTLKRAW